MDNSLHYPTNIIRIDHHKENKSFPCCGLDCNNAGSHKLTIVYINKAGIFCDQCKQDLIKSRLVKSEDN
jgi:hypothetical protein